MAADDDETERWILFDFGGVQFVEDVLAGEFLRVHGPGALFDDGPFRLVNDGGRPLLLGLSGNDLTRSIHLADEHIKYIISWPTRPGTGAVEAAISPSDGPAACVPEFIEDLRARVVGRVLKIDVDGENPWKGVFVWHAAPIAIPGSRPVRLWLQLNRIFHYVGGPQYVDRFWRHAAKLRNLLESVSLSSGHCLPSALSEKREGDGMDDATSIAQRTGRDWNGTLLAVLFLLLDMSSSSKYLRGDPNLRRKANALLKALLVWPSDVAPDKPPLQVTLPCGLNLLIKDLQICIGHLRRSANGAGLSSQTAKLQSSIHRIFPHFARPLWAHRTCLPFASAAFCFQVFPIRRAQIQRRQCYPRSASALSPRRC